MPALANQILPFLKDAQSISGESLLERLLQDDEVHDKAARSHLDLAALFSSTRTLEHHAEFDDDLYKQFESAEQTIRTHVSPALENAGSAFPSWRLGGRCTPLAFAMLQGFPSPGFSRYAHDLEEHRNPTPYDGTPVNTIPGLTLFCVRLIERHISPESVRGFKAFISALEEP